MSSGTQRFQFDAVLGCAEADRPWALQLARRLTLDGVEILTCGADLDSCLTKSRHVLWVPPAMPAHAPFTAPSAEGFDPLGATGARRRLLVPLLRRDVALPIQLQAFPPVDVRTFEALERAYPRLLAELKDGAPPSPAYAGERQRQLGEELEAAQSLLDRLQIAGAQAATVGQVQARVVQLKRELRDWGDLMEGYILGGRFRLLDELGAGGFATVWRAWDRIERRAVALKVLHPQHLRHPDKVQRFFSGAQRMGGLRHRHIARVYLPEAVDGAHHYYVMELVEGVSLEVAVLAAALSRSRVLAVVSQLGQALHYAHQAGVVHRDIKPNNVLLDSLGEVRLVDFDLAGLNSNSGDITTADLGTFVYTAPEPARQSDDNDVRRDVYGLAMTCLFMLYGGHLEPAMLFEREAFIADLDVPEPAKRVLERAVSLKPGRRHGTIAAFVGALVAAFEEQQQS